MDAALEALRERLAAGGWVSVGLIFLVSFLFVRLLAARQRQRSLMRQLHGARVRSGHVAESLAPLLDDFPVEVGKAGTATLFLGQPVDYVHFDPDDGVTFIEIKSGRALLSSRQRRFRELVEAGQVRWCTYRIGP